MKPAPLAPLVACLPCCSARALDAPARRCACAAGHRRQCALDYAVTASRPPLRLEGTNRLEYASSAGRYTLRSVLEAGGLYSARQESTGSVDIAGWWPNRYEERTTRRGTNSASIDWGTSSA